MCSANAQGRSPEGAIEWRRERRKKKGGKEADRVREGEEEVRSGLQDGEEGKEWKRKDKEGGEGGGSQAALYPDRSPLHTNFLVKEEKMALNPEKSFSPGAGLSAEG